jgi:hypothetical protein
MLKCLTAFCQNKYLNFLVDSFSVLQPLTCAFGDVKVLEKRKKERKKKLFFTLMFHDLVERVFPIPVLPIWKFSMLQLSEASTSTIKIPL